MRNYFSENLTKLIKSAKLSLRTISVATDIPITTLQRWSAEKAQPRLDTRLLRLSNYFQVPVRKLLFEELENPKLKRISGKIEKPVNGKQLEFTLVSGKINNKLDLDALSNCNASACKNVGAAIGE